MATKYLAEVFAPGEHLREELEAREWSQIEFAQIIGKTPTFVNEILAGKRGITPETAQALSDALGTSAELWLNLESLYRLSRSQGHDERITRRALLYDKAPVNDMLKRGWIKATDDIDQLEASILKFLELSSLSDTPKLSAAARKSGNYDSTTASQWAWYYRAKHLAESVPVVADYSKELLSENLGEIRKLATAPEELTKLPKVLSEVGVRFVVVEHLPKTKIDGAAFWLSETEPVIAISLRYDRIDAFWHTLTHELAHIYQGHAFVLDSDLVGTGVPRFNDKPPIEQEADKMACEFLVPKDNLDAFIARVRPLYAKAKIREFAKSIGVHPGIVVGQLQHREEIGYQHSRDLLVKVREIVISTALTDGWGSIPELIDTEA